jgi:hypothetical protein
MKCIEILILKIRLALTHYRARLRKVSRCCGITTKPATIVDARARLLEMARVWQHLADEQGRATNVQQQQAHCPP